MSESRGVWFLLGLSLGAMAGVLFAPQSGDETRDFLSRKADMGRDLVQRRATEIRNQASSLREQAGSLRDQAGTLREQAVQFADRGKQAVNRQIDQFQAAVEAGKQAFRESAAGDKPDRGAENTTL